MIDKLVWNLIMED